MSSEAEADESEPSSGYLLIKNETVDGKKFRPSDWADRLQSTLSCLGEDGFSHCIDLLQIVTQNGDKCILLDRRLIKAEPRLYRFLMRFCKENRLATEERQGKEPEAAADKPQQVNSFRRALSF